MTLAFRFDLASTRIGTLEAPQSRLVISSPRIRWRWSRMGWRSRRPLWAAGSTRPSTRCRTRGLTFSSVVTSGLLRPLQHPYPDWPPEGLTFTSTMVSGELRQLLRTYPDWPAEGLTFESAVTSGALSVVLVTYANWPTEGLTFSSTITSGTLHDKYSLWALRPLCHAREWRRSRHGDAC